MSSTPTHNSQTITLCNLRFSNSNRHLSECCSPVAVWKIPIRLLSPESAYVQRVPSKWCQRKNFFCRTKIFGLELLPKILWKPISSLCKKLDDNEQSSHLMRYVVAIIDLLHFSPYEVYFSFYLFCFIITFCHNINVTFLSFMTSCKLQNIKPQLWEMPLFILLFISLQGKNGFHNISLLFGNICRKCILWGKKHSFENYYYSTI